MRADLWNLGLDVEHHDVERCAASTLHERGVRNSTGEQPFGKIARLRYSEVRDLDDFARRIHIATTHERGAPTWA